MLQMGDGTQQNVLPDIKKCSLDWLFTEECQRFGARPAIQSTNGNLSFFSLHEHSLRIAARLQKEGILPRSIIGVSSESTPEAIAAYFGILLAGCIVLPLDPLWKKSFVESIVSKCSPKLILTGSSSTTSYFEGCGSTMPIKEALLEEAPSCPPLLEISPKEAAFLIFTPHTPEGVELTHLSFLNLVFWYKTRYRFGTSDIGTSFARPGTGMFALDMITFLLNGVKLKFPKETLQSEPKEFIEWVRAEQITLCRLPTLIAEKMLEEEWPKAMGLRILFLYGAQLKKKPKREHPFSLILTYGQLETGLVATEFLVRPTEDSIVIPIGEPIANVKTFILNESLQEVKEGEAGELCIGGLGVAKGYYDDPEKTHEKFVIHTKLGKRPSTLFLTGDLVRKKENGLLEYLGNIDRQIAVGNYRLELTAIDSLLSSHPGVYQSYSATVDLQGERELIAWWVRKKGSNISKKDLRKYLRQNLPGYMIPKGLIELAELPIRADGSICLEQLPMPCPKEPLYEEPQTPIEFEMERLWEHHFGQKGGNLFAIEAGSEKGKLLLQTVKRHFGKKIDELQFYRDPTVRGLALALQGNMKDTGPLIQASKTQNLTPLLCLFEEREDLYTLFFLAYLLEKTHSVSGYFMTGSVEEERDRLLPLIGETSLFGMGEGGYLAYELAQKGVKAPFVGLFETPAPLGEKGSSKMVRMCRAAAAFYRMDRDEKKEFLIHKMEEWEYKTAHLFDKPEKRTKKSDYIPEKTKQEITIFTLAENHHSDLSLGWNRYAPKLLIRKVQGTSETAIFRDLAQKIRND